MVQRTYFLVIKNFGAGGSVVAVCVTAFSPVRQQGCLEGFGAALASSTDSPSPLQQDFPVLGSSV